MICSSSSPPIRRLRGEGRGPRGFTLVELLVVILILAVLIALLLPALNGALKTARKAAVGAEINQLAQALASFKAKYGDYPPSRIYLAENGDFGSAAFTAIGPGDITYAQLAQRSVAALRKFFPRVVLNTSGGAVFSPGSSSWYDFNGNGVMDDGYYILQGHECLAFFLGGIPTPNPPASLQVPNVAPLNPLAVPTSFAMSGFGKDPTNPFSNNIFSDPRLPLGNGQYSPNPMYSGNRQSPLFEFANNRLALDPNGLSGIPGYVDSLGNPAPPQPLLVKAGQLTPQVPAQNNFYVYFNAYGNGGYDPNDANFVEYDASGTGPTPLGIELGFLVNFPVTGGCVSPAPNPYTSTTTVSSTGLAKFLNGQSFQIISSGIDGQYGVGGQYTPNTTGEALPLDTSIPDPYNTSDTTIRVRERDNITNFHNGKLE